MNSLFSLASGALLPDSIITKSSNFFSKNVCVILTLLLVLNGIHSKAQDVAPPFNFEASVFTDFGANPIGGIKRGSWGLGISDIGLSFNTENAHLWKGGEFYMQIENTFGAVPASAFVGDFQAFDNAEAGLNTCLYQLYYSQQLGKSRIIIGQHDLNSDFNVSETGGSFINSSFGIIPSISANMPVSIFPINTLAFIVHSRLSESIMLSAGIYDGDPGDFETNPYGVKWKLSADEGALAIGEFCFSTSSNAERMGAYKIGGYYHTSEFQSLTNPDVVTKGNYGLYFLGDQMIFSESEEQGLFAFVQAGFAPGDINFVDSYFGGGLLYRGLFPERNEEEIGIGIAHCSFNNSLVSASGGMLMAGETAIEFLYHFVINDHLEIQPDVQYIITPSGDSSISNPLIVFIRTSLNF